MTDENDVELALAELFDRYADGYDDYDVNGILSCFTYPIVVWQLGDGHVFADRDELIENLEALLEAHRENGVVQSVYEFVSSHVSGSTAYVTLDWQQEDEDGETVFDFTCHYVLMLFDNEWKVISIINEPS
ncbi:YybH family protein [Flexibacterium corallicola]|uniref:YybH family protein n=1 Tax=Flexibacterium corallicola TaxID=3037259 RepID=UPI00286F020B|nr:DUF4440 domain-containing protein [Pseudovibrio sp. M1P-2-3]